MFDRPTQVVAGGVCHQNAFVRAFSPQALSEDLVEPRTVLMGHALVSRHLDERVRESEPARTEMLDQPLPFQCGEVTLDKWTRIAR